jgi:hypothetical protein
MKFLVRVILLFVISCECYEESRFVPEIIPDFVSNAIDSKLTKKCKEVLNRRNIQKAYNRRIDYNFEEHNASSEDFVTNFDDFCNAVWGAYCCDTKLYESECSTKDQQAFEEYINKDAEKIQFTFCLDYPSESDFFNSLEQIIVKSYFANFNYKFESIL